VGGKDEPGAQGDEAVAAKAVELHLLEHAEKLDLSKEAEVADFIEEEGSIARLLEVSFASAVGAGKGAFLVAE